MRIPYRSTCVRPVRKFRFCIIGLALAGLLASVRSAQAAEIILYSDTFNGSVVNDLAGTTPDTTIGSNTWQGNTGFKADGSIAGVSGGIYLPFAPTPGSVYTLTATFFTDAASSDWLGAGFSGGSTTSTSGMWANAGRGWALAKNTDPDYTYEAYIGPGTANGTSGNIISPGNQTSTLTVTLDASNANAALWTFSSTLQVNTTNYAIWTNVNANVTSASDITAIGLSASSGTGRYTSFSLTVVPEPSTYVLGTVASVFVVSLARFRKRTALAG